MIVNRNGQFVDPEGALAVTDGAFLFGDTLFETLRAQGQKVLFAGRHLDRLELSARLLDFPCDRPRIEAALAEIEKRLQAPASRLRLTLSRGPFTGLGFPPPETGHFVLTASPLEEPTEEERKQGADCVIAPNRRVNPLSHLPQMKRGNYADCLYAAKYARSRGVREALFVTEGGEILEGATSNLFLLRDGVLATPPAGELVLGGIRRRLILEIAQEAGIACEERPVLRSELAGAEEVFLTNSLFDVLAVSSVEGELCRRGDVGERLRRILLERA